MLNSIWRVGLGYALAIAALVYVARYLGINGEAFADALRGISISAMVLALLAFCFQVCINALAFAPLNRAFGVDVPPLRISQIWASSLLAKYVPGGVWHVVGRGLMLSRLGVSVRTSAVVGVAEQAVSLSICLFISVMFFLTSIGQGEVLVLCAAASAGVLFWWAPLLLSRFVMPVSRGPWLWAVGGYALAMAPYALGYLILMMPADTAAFLKALFTGTVVGVLALPVPGGLGVRESSAVLLVSPAQAGPVMATMVAARVLILVAESAISAVGLAALRLSKIRP